MTNDKTVSLHNLKVFLQQVDDTYLRKDGLEYLSDEEIRLMFVRPANEVKDETILKEKINRGGQIDIMSNINLIEASGREDRIIFYKGSTVNFHDSEISISTNASSAEPNKNWSALYVEEGANVVFEGNKGGIKYQGNVPAGQDGPYCITNFGGTITIKSGNYHALGTCVYGYAGTTIIEGGYFEATKSTPDTRPVKTWTLNLLNSAYQDGTAKMIVRGGTFVDFDPSNPGTDDASSYVDEGYKVVSEVVDGHTLYSVVKE